MKQKVIEFFQNLPAEKHEQFNQAFALYRDCPKKNLIVERTLNSSGYTERGLENLLYDLQKLNDISDVEKMEVRSAKVEVVRDGEGLSTEVISARTEALNVSTEALEARTEALSVRVDAVKELSDVVELSGTAIRVEFPFLNAADCPNELKILVADKITAWNRYVALQKQISEAEANGNVDHVDLAVLAKEAVACFKENQKIYDELNCYQTTGEILGVHPIFKKLQLTREVEALTADELIKYKASSAKYFSVNKTALDKAKKAKDEAKVQEIEARVAERHDKLFLVNKKLGV